MKNKQKIKKVGILSMQRIKNYGSFLQAYALKALIEENTNSVVEFVDYHIEQPLITDKGKNKILEILKNDATLKQKIQYIKYKKNFTKNYKVLGINSVYNYNPNLDVLVIGSDEVFNCIQSNKNVGYSLELFGKNNNAKKVITYAASFGNTTLEKLKQFNREKEIACLLNKIDTISVRDKNSEKIISKLTNKEVVSNLDPVLIYDYMNQKNLIPEIKPTEKYMILYAYSGRISKNEAKKIKDYASQNNLKIYAIGGVQKYCDKFIDCEPFEVLAYFKKAECIVTDTFHGSIFSIINNKPFVTLVRKSKGNSYGNEEKIEDLLNRLGLKDRMITDVCNMPKILNLKIDYEKTNNIIKKNRNQTISYLKEEIE